MCPIATYRHIKNILGGEEHDHLFMQACCMGDICLFISTRFWFWVLGLVVRYSCNSHLDSVCVHLFWRSPFHCWCASMIVQCALTAVMVVLIHTASFTFSIIRRNSCNPLTVICYRLVIKNQTGNYNSQAPRCW